MLVGLSLVYWFYAIFVPIPSKQQTKHFKTLSVCKNLRILIIGATGSAANVLRAPGSTVKCNLVPRFSLLPVSRGCSALLWSPFGFEFWKQKLEMLTYRSLWNLNFGSLMLLSFSAISSQTFLSQLFQVCSWTVRSTRSPTPWCLTCMTTNLYLSERPNVLNKLHLSSSKSRYFLYISFRFVLKVR